MVGDPLDRAIGAAVIDAEHGRSRHACARRASRQLRDRPAPPTRRPAASSIAGASDSRRPPSRKSSSHRMTRAPARPAVKAAASPAGPAPITSTSQKAWALS